MEATRTEGWTGWHSKAQQGAKYRAKRVGRTGNGVHAKRRYVRILDLVDDSSVDYLSVVDKSFPIPELLSVGTY